MEANKNVSVSLVLSINSQAKKFLFMACENQGYLRQATLLDAMR
jgi:hypothetical protein